MPTTFPPFHLPTSTHQAYTKELEVGGALPRHPTPLTLLPNTPGTQNETILRCNWQQRTRKKERKKEKKNKLATKKVAGMSCWNKLQGTGAAVENPRYAGHTKGEFKVQQMKSFSATEPVHMNSSRRKISPLPLSRSVQLLLSCRQIGNPEHTRCSAITSS